MLILHSYSRAIRPVIVQEHRDLLCRFAYKHDIWHRCNRNIIIKLFEGAKAGVDWVCHIGKIQDGNNIFSVLDVYERKVTCNFKDCKVTCNF